MVKDVANLCIGSKDTRGGPARRCLRLGRLKQIRIWGRGQNLSGTTREEIKAKHAVPFVEN